MNLAISLSVGYKELEPQAEAIIEICNRYNINPTIIFAGHEVLDPVGCAMAVEAVSSLGEDVTRTAFAQNGTFSRAYLCGWEVGASVADFVISMDADGAHDPSNLPLFIECFRDGRNIVLGSRGLPGSINEYPLQRRLVSLISTFVANQTLVPIGSKGLTDFTSGFEGLSSDIIRRIFEIWPPAQWISATDGPYHLQNTILRLLLLQLEEEITEVPIQYGLRKKGSNLSISYLVQALNGYLKVRSQYGLLRNGEYNLNKLT